MESLTIALAGAPVWAEDLTRAVTGMGHRLAAYPSTEGYIPRLAADHAALIVVDGDSPGWRFWITSPRVNAATRRIPIVVVSADPARRADGLGAGADFALPPADIPAELPALIAAQARRTDGPARAALAAACGEPLPPQAREAIEQFNRGEYYRQHDLLEAQWMAEAGPVRDLYRAILQVGIACYQVERGNVRGALKMLWRSQQWLAILPDVCQGVDVAALRADSDRLQAALEAWPEGRDLADFDRSLLVRVRLAA